MATYPEKFALFCYNSITRINVGNVSTNHRHFESKFSSLYCDNAVLILWLGFCIKAIWLGLGKHHVLAKSISFRSTRTLPDMSWGLDQNWFCRRKHNRIHSDLPLKISNFWRRKHSCNLSQGLLETSSGSALTNVEAVLSCVHHHSLHLLIRKSCHKHVAWTWYDTYCKNCQCGNYKCERISGLEKQKSKQKLPTLYPGNSAVGSSILCYISRFSTVCGGRQLVSDCSQLPPLHLPLICIKKQPYWIWSKG